MGWTPISRAYVFSTLKGEPRPVGVVNLDGGIYAFGYAKSWLARSDAYPLDPLHLPLSTQIFESPRLFGALTDSLPDNWGQRVVLATHKQTPGNPIEWLLAMRGRGVGALAFSAARSKVLEPNTPPTLDDLDRLLAAMDKIQASQSLQDPELIHLVEYGSSFGGARPKTIVVDGDREWLAKLSRNDDAFDQIGAEAASLAMARDLGIQTPEFRIHRVNGRSVLLVARFDRIHRQPSVHYLSGESALNIRKIRETDFAGEYSYQGLASVIRKISEAPKEDLRELYQRMAFNVAIGNTDDHLKNHGFVYSETGGWRLAPAFDLLPHPEQFTLHAIGIGGQGRQSSIENVLSRAGVFGMKRCDAEQIIEQTLEMMASANDYFLDYGLPEVDAGLLARICQRFVELSPGQP